VNAPTSKPRDAQAGEMQATRHPAPIRRQQCSPGAFPGRRLYGRLWPASREGSRNGLALQRSPLDTSAPSVLATRDVLRLRCPLVWEV